MQVDLENFPIEFADEILVKKAVGRGPCLLSRRTLPAGVIDGVLPGENDLGNRDEGVALLEEGLDDGGQGLRGVEGGVVKEDDGAGLHLGGHSFDDLPRLQVLPVQAVTECNKGKSLRHRCFRCLQAFFSSKQAVMIWPVSLPGTPLFPTV